MKKLFYRTAALLFCLLVFGCNENDGEPLGAKTSELRFITLGGVIEVVGGSDGITNYVIDCQGEEFSISSELNYIQDDKVRLELVFDGYNFGVYKLSGITIKPFDPDFYQY